MEATEKRLLSVAGVLRGALGTVSLVGGLTWLLLNLHGPQFGTDLLVGLVFAAGGLVLLMPHRLILPGGWSTLTAALTALAGTAAGIGAVTSAVCCTYAYQAARGYPFHWLQRGAVAGDPSTARRLAEGANWQVDVVGVLADLFFWGFLGLLAVATVVAVRRAVRDRVGVRP